MSEPPTTSRPRIVIMGAAGRDFHTFNTIFRDDPASEVVAFTAAQIPGIAGRRYPASLAGPLYPNGLPIVDEAELPDLIRRHNVDWVYLAYSDLAHVEVMHRASIALAAGASFGLLSPRRSMLSARVPVISVGAVRTGAGKSAVSRYLVRWLREQGQRVVAIRHPMPYGDLERQAVQRFARYADLDAAQATIEEREEYEPYLGLGAVVYAGVDYGRILAAAQTEADVVVWDGGNNDLPFIHSDLHLVLTDAQRPGQELTYHPGETNLRTADAIIIAKVNSAPAATVARMQTELAALRPGIPQILGELVVSVDRPELIRGRRVVLVEDGPTLTHGGLAQGAATVAARQYAAAAIVDARPYAVGSIAAAYQHYPHLEGEVPAMGYSQAQIDDLATTLRRVPAETVVDASPVDLGRLIQLDRPIVAVSYEFRERGTVLADLLTDFARRRLSAGEAP